MENNFQIVVAVQGRKFGSALLHDAARITQRALDRNNRLLVKEIYPKLASRIPNLSMIDAENLVQQMHQYGLIR